MYKELTNPLLVKRIKEGQKIKCGLFIARLQPLHLAHLYIIEKALSECDALLIFLGSSNKSETERNPFSAELRLEMLNDALKSRDYYDRIAIDSLPDWAGESHSSTFGQWGHYLYYNAVSRMCVKNFTMYYCDAPEKVSGWFDEEVKGSVEMRFLDREGIFDGLSSTKVREALEKMGKEDIIYLRRYLPDSVFERIYSLSEIWRAVKSSPKADFNINRAD